MKKCPFCGADIEESARFCLYCMQSFTEKKQILPPKKKKPKWLLIISAVVTAFLVLAIFLLGRQFKLQNEMLSDDSHLHSDISSNQTDFSYLCHSFYGISIADPSPVLSQKQSHILPHFLPVFKQEREADSLVFVTL